LDVIQGEKMYKGKYFLLKSLLTILILLLMMYIAGILEYFSQFQAFDNITGIMPFILLLCVTGFSFALVWTIHKKISTSTIVFSLMTIFCSLLFIPAITGN